MSTVTLQSMKKKESKKKSVRKERYNHEAWCRVGVGVRFLSGRSCNQCSIVASTRPALLVPCRGFTALGWCTA